jgi:hypothetical protein
MDSESHPPMKKLSPIALNIPAQFPVMTISADAVSEGDAGMIRSVYTGYDALQVDHMSENTVAFAPVEQ